MPSIRTLFPSLICLLALSSTKAQDPGPIGSWQDHFPYLQAVAVAQGGGHVYSATATALFKYHPPTGEIERITKVNALNDVGINGLAWNPSLSMLLVYYANGNLDLLRESEGFNMGDIKRSGILGDKGVYCAYMDGVTAYLGCGFGIVVVDLAQREVRETWFIGPEGSQIRVNDIVFHNDSIYAATQDGLFVAWQGASNLASFTNWQKRTDLPAAMANGPFNTLASFGGRVLVNYRSNLPEGDTLLLLNESGVERFTPLYGRRNLRMHVSDNGERLIVPHKSDIHTYDLDLAEISFQYGYVNTFCNPSEAIADGNDLWVSDTKLGLVRAQGQNIGYNVVPNGPRSPGVYRMAASGGALYVATGAVQGNWTNSFLKEGVHHYQNGSWISHDWENSPFMMGVNDYGGAVNDIMAVAVDPSDPSIAYAGSFEEGLIEFRDRVPYTTYNSTNSSLQDELGAPSGKVNIAGLAFDRDRDLWMTNPYSPACIAVKTNAGTWKNFSPGAILNSNFLLGDIMVASNGHKWIIRPRGNALLVFDDGGTIDNTSDDRYRLLNNQAGSGGLPTNEVYSMAEDLDGQIWVGTNRGVAVFYNPSAVFGEGDFDAQQILIEQDGNIQILLETEEVRAIAVDGANRKWIGTETSGVFLISADGREQVARFTEVNSPLPSNTVTTIAIDDATGEVYFGTSRGIISFRSDATLGGNENRCAKVFPNPVRETYTGPIAITDLVRDSEVKITDMAGNLVYRTNSLGGQAIWPGTNMGGDRVATGVYLVMVADRFGNTKCNTKLLVVR